MEAASLDPQTRIRYEAREKALKDMASLRGEGLREGKQEVAKKMLSKGLDIELIVEMTELSYEEVTSLRDEMNH
ncbi:transposase [Schinkia azotoformans]|uniref:transposase n=1 Tax=Schinkia azotoformans TaxID=1454 RepID=UPI002E23EB2F|nr:transposase [Schinkia azotoformans]